MDDSFKIYFVNSDNNRENEPSMVEAYELLKEHEQKLDVEMISQEDCLSVKIKGKPSHKIFVFNNFEGKAFHHVQDLGCRIYGPQCIISILQHSMDIPSAKKRPIFSLAMKDIKVCCTSIDRNARNEVERLVHLMSGEVVRDLTDDSTHLIAGEVGSIKYMVALQRGKSVMTKEWVHQVWELAKTKHILGTDELFHKYKCPPFLGLTVCVSGFKQAERNQMKNYVIKGGGKYSGELRMNECTHLIVKEPNGAKYEAAKSWKVKTVSDRWLFDSVDKGTYLDPKPYHFVKGAQTSTPERLSDAVPNITDVSAISGIGETTFQAINETDMLSSRVSMQLNATRTTLGETKQDITSAEMDTTVVFADIFLDGCRIFLSGIEPAMQEKLKKIITTRGGFRTTELDMGVTHVIVGKQIQSDISVAYKLTDRPFMIRSDWLMDCYHKNSHLDEKDYTVNVFDAVDQHSSVKARASLEKGSCKTPQGKDEDCPSYKVDEAASDLQMAELLSQYIPQDEEMPAADNDTVVGNPPQEEESKEESGAGGDDNEGPQPEDEMTQDPNAHPDEAVDCVEQNGIFNNKVFIFLGLTEENNEELKEHVESSGGRVMNLNLTRQIADIAIVPLSGYPVNATVPEILTVTWLHMCLESEELVPTSHWLARPIEIPEGEPLSGCCISVSGFSGAERDSIMYILQCLGAFPQSMFARRTTKKAQACTHLLTSVPEGSKYTAAKQWGIPTLSKTWLIACITSGKKPPESDEFDIEFALEKENEEEEVHKDQSSELPSLNSTTKQAHRGSSSTTDDDRLGGGLNPLSADDADLMTADLDIDVRPEEKPTETTPCLEEPMERVQSSKDNSQSSAGTDLNPLREVTSMLKNTTVNTLASSSPKRVDDEKRKKGMTVDENRESSLLPPAGPQRTPVNARLRELAVQDGNKSSSSSGSGSVKESDKTPSLKTSHLNQLELGAFTFSPITPKTVGEDLNKSTPLGEVFTRSLMKSVANLKNWKNDATPGQSQPEYLGPLHSVVIAVAKKLGNNHMEYNTMVVELGGDYTWQYNDKCTHFVFQGRPNDTNKEFRKARDDNKFIVSPHWLFMCKEQACKVDESLFPHHYNPNQALTLITDKEMGLRSSRRAGTRNKAAAKGETPIKAGGSGKTPARKRPVLNMHAMIDKDDEKGAKSSEFKPIGVKTAENETPTVPSDFQNQFGGTAIITPDISSTKKTDDVSDEASSSAISDERSKDQELKEALSKTLGTVLAEASSRSRKTSRKKGKRILAGQRNSSSGNTPESTLTRTTGAGWSAKGETKDSNSLPEPSQSVQVMWDDPTERLEKEKLAHRLERVCDPSQNTDDCLAAMHFREPGDAKNGNGSDDQRDDRQSKSNRNARNEETYRSPTPEAPSIAFPVARPASSIMSPQPVELLSEESSDSRMENAGGPMKKVPAFMFSGMQNEERVDYGALIEELGGKMMEKQHFDPACTHLVVAQPVRNEKYLSSVAAGNWVLHKSYFEACRKDGRLVKEENHEWGSNFTLPLMQNMTAQAFKLAAAAFKWRKKVSSLRKSNPACGGAFHGWDILLCLDKNKEQNFQRLLEAGGATVQILRPPFPQSLTAGYAFLDLNKVKVPQEELEKLIRLNIHCLKAEFIAAYITDDPQPDPSDFYPPEVAALKMCMPSDESPSRKRKAAFDSHDSIRQSEKIPRH